MIELAALPGMINDVPDEEIHKRIHLTGLSVDGESDPFKEGDNLPEGWLTPPDQELLRRYSRGCDLVVNLGTCHGRSAAILSRSAGVVLTVDDFRFPGTASITTALWLRRFRNVLSLVGDTANLSRWVTDGQVDLLFIDGDHHYEPVRRDYHAWASKIAPGGLVIFHDYCVVKPEVVLAVNELITAGELEEVEMAGWSIVTRQRKHTGTV